MTKQEWIDEVTAALDGGSALRWRLSRGLVEQGSPMCYAEVTDEQRTNVRRISLARDRFRTPAARRDEILRQLRRDVV